MILACPRVLSIGLMGRVLTAERHAPCLPGRRCPGAAVRHRRPLVLLLLLLPGDVEGGASGLAAARAGGRAFPARDEPPRPPLDLGPVSRPLRVQHRVLSAWATPALATWERSAFTQATLPVPLLRLLLHSCAILADSSAVTVKYSDGFIDIYS